MKCFIILIALFMFGCTGTCTIRCKCNTGGISKVVVDGVTARECKEEADIVIHSEIANCDCAGDWVY